MSPHDMMKKKTKESGVQAGPVETQRTREQDMFVQSIARQYEEARKEEAKLARQLRQGPPDGVIKKGRWTSKKKRALDELSKRNKERFGVFAREGEEAASRTMYALRQGRNEALEQGREWNEDGISQVFRESVMGDEALTDLVEKDTEISSEFQKLTGFYERLYQNELPAGELAAEFLAFAKTASVDFGPGIRHLTEREGQGICVGTVPVTEQPEVLRMVLFQSVATALFQCMDQVGLESVNLEAFAKMRAAAQASSVVCGELFLDRKYREEGKQENEERHVVHEKVRLEAERAEREQNLQQEQERLKKEAKPQQDAEYEKINHRQIEKFLEDGRDIHTLSWAKEQYPGWIREALAERITDHPAEFSTEMMRTKERMDARLAEIQAFVEQHRELTCGIPMFEAVQCRRLAELAGVGVICGEQRLDGTKLQKSQEQLLHNTEEETRTYRRRQEILQENIPGLDPKEWEAFWKAPELEKLILHTENEAEFRHHANMIGIHAKMNEKIIRQLTNEEGLTVGADYAAEEIQKLLGVRFLLGPFAGVEMDARFYISNLNTYVPQAFAMEQKFRNSMKKNGISDAIVGPLAEALKLTQVNLSDQDALERNVKKWKTVAEQNASWLSEKLEKEQLTTDQWETIQLLEKQSLLVEQVLFQDTVQNVLAWKHGDAPLLSRKDYLYGEKGKELNVRTEIYRKQLEGADLCEAEEFHGLLAGKQEKEMAGRALETLLKRGKLQEAFPYLKEIKNLRELDQLTHEQYYELTAFLRNNVALAIQPWSEVVGPGTSEVKEKLLEQLFLGNVTAENIGQETERQQEKWKKAVKAEDLRLYTVLGSETQEEKPLVVRYLKVGAKTGVKLPEKRLQKMDTARKLWKELREKGLEERMLSYLYRFVSDFYREQAKKGEKGIGEIRNGVLRDYMTKRLFKAEKDGSAGMEPEDQNLLKQVFDKAAKNQKQKNGLMLEFLMCGMEHVLMAPDTEGEALLYDQEEANYEEGLSRMAEEVSWRLHFAEETAKIVYHDEAQEEQRSQLFDRLKRMVVQMEPFPGSKAMPDEAMRQRNQERFGAASPEELLSRTLNLAASSPDGNILERSEVKEAAEVYQKRVELLKQQGSRGLSLLIPFMTEDKGMWRHMMTDEDDAFTVYLAKWVEKRPALTQLEDLPESYGWQFVAEKTNEIMAGTGDEQYWKQEIKEFMSRFANRRVDGTSINERRESFGKWQYMAMAEEDLHSGVLGLDILYDNDRLGQVFKTYEKQEKTNGKALAAYLKTQKVPKEKAKQFALQMQYHQVKEKPEDFAENLNRRYETFLRNGQDEKSEQERLKKLNEDRKKAREEIISMRAQGEKAAEKDRKILERLRAQYWKSGSVILAASGVWGDLDQKAILKTREALEKNWGDETSEDVLELLKEVKLANPKMKEAELGNIRQWLLDAEQMIREKGATKDLGRDEQNRLLTYLYLHYYKAADFAVSEISVRKVHNEWTERRNVLLELTGCLKTITVPSLAMEMRDLILYLQMGIFTLNQQEFDELAERQTTYFENAQILHEIIEEEVETESERVQEDGTKKLFSDTFAAEIRVDFMECFRKYAAGKPLEEADREKVRTEVRDCLQTEDKFRYVLDSRSSMGSVSWDDLKLEEKNGTAVNRKDLEELIESTGSEKQVEWYNSLTVPQRKLFALGLMMCDQDRSLFTARLAVELRDAVHTHDWFQEQVSVFVSHGEFEPEIDYAMAVEQIRKGKKQIDEDQFEEIRTFTELCMTMYQENIPKDWNRMTDGISSVEAAWRMQSKHPELAKQRMEEAGKQLENAQAFSGWLCKQAKADKKEKVTDRLWNLDESSLRLLVLILQDRTVLDRTTGVGAFDMSGGAIKPRVNEEARYELFGKVTGKDRALHLAEADGQEMATQAMRSLLSFQLRDDVDLNGRMLQEDDFADGVLKRKTLLDWDLLEEALQTLEKAENAVLRVQAIRSSAKIIEMMPNEKAKAGYRDCREKEINSEETFTDYLKKQALKDLDENSDIPALMAGFFSLNAQEKKLFVRALTHRDILDVSKKNFIGSFFGDGDRNYVNPQERNRLAEEYIQKSYSETDVVSVQESDFKEALFSLFSTQISDNVDFADQKEVGLQEQRSYETFRVDKEGIQTTRTTGLDWKLFARALQFVNRTSSEAQILQQDREIYYSMGDTFENGAFTYDTEFMRQNLHRSGNRWNRFFSRLIVKEGKRMIPLSDVLQQVLIGVTAACSPAMANKINKSVFSQKAESEGVAGILRDISTGGKATGEFVENAAKAVLTHVTGKKVTETIISGAQIIQKAMESVAIPAAIVEPIERVMDIAVSVSAYVQYKEDREEAEDFEKDDLKKQKKAEENQTERQKERSRKGLERNQKGLEAADTQISHDQIGNIVKSIVGLIGSAVNAADRTIMTKNVRIGVDSGLKIARFLRQIYTDHRVLEDYLSLSGGQNEKLKLFQEKLTGEERLDRNQPKEKLADQYSDRELYQKAMGFENRDELVESVVLEVVRALLFSASRFNSQLALKIQAMAALTALGFQDQIGKTGSAAANRIYASLSAKDYK